MIFKCCKKPDQSTRDRLVETAAGLLLRQSYGTVSVEDICKSADIKKGTFYHHFPSKVELALAAYDHMWAKAQEALDPCFDRMQAPDIRLKRFADAFYNWQKGFFDTEGKIYGCAMATAGQEMGALDDRIRDKAQIFCDGHIDYYKGLVRDWPGFEQANDAEIEQTSRALFSFVQGVLYHAKIANDPEVIQKDLYLGLQRLLHLSPSEERSVAC